MKSLIHKYLNFVPKLEDSALFLLRVVIAYGLFHPAIMKWQDINAIAEWFGSMNYPFPLLNAYLAATTEILGVILLTLGLGTRFITIPLIITMIVAITTVHIGHGFNAGDNGFEIPLYYLIIFITLLAQGAGKYSLDYFLFEKNKV